MTSWSPRERMNVFRSWLKGSLSLIHLHVLTVLEADGPLPMSGSPTPSTYRSRARPGSSSRMEERGLVERGHDREDRRVVLVQPTATGLAVFQDLTPQRREHLTQLLGRLSDEELQGFLTGLRAMRAAREPWPRNPAEPTSNRRARVRRILHSGAPADDRAPPDLPPARTRRSSCS